MLTLLDTFKNFINDSFISYKYDIQKNTKIRMDYIIDKKLPSTINYINTYLVTHKQTQQKRIIKCFQFKHFSAAEKFQIVQLFNDFNSISHQNFLTIFDIIINDYYLAIVMECSTGYSLQAYMNQEKKLTEKEAANYIYQLLHSYSYLHDAKINIGNLNLKKLFLKTSKYGSNSNIVKLAFSFCLHQFDKANIANEIDNLKFYAPEIIYDKASATNKSDSWTAGIILYIFLCGKTPFDGINYRNIEKNILSEQVEIHEKISEEAKDLILKLLEKNPDQRISSEEAINHEWFKILNL